MTSPRGWTLTSVGELASSFRSGDAFLKLEYTTDGVPVLAKGDIKPFGRIAHSEKRFLEASIAETRGYTLTEPDDLLVTTRDLTQKGNVLGLAAPVPQDQPYLVNQGANVLRLKNPALNRYFVYWTNGPVYRDFMRANFVGSTQIHIRHGDVMRAPVWMPPDDERVAIVEVLGALDDKIEHNRLTGRALERLARATFKAWFIDFEPVKAKAAGRSSFPGMPPSAFSGLPDSLVDSPIGRLPEGWEVRSVGDIATLSKQHIDPQDYAEESFEHFSIPSFDAGQNPVVESGDGILSQKFVVAPGCVLLSKLNPRIARVWLPSPSTGLRQIASTEFLVVVPRAGWSREAIYCLFQQDGFRESLAQSASGTSNSHQRVRPADLLLRPIITPPQPMLDAFAEQSSHQMALRDALHIEASRLAALRDYLLPRLLSGRVRASAAQGQVTA